MTKPKSSWKGILQAVDTKTKVLALVCLVLEAALLGSLPQLPESDRFAAFLVGAAVLSLMIIGIFLIEINDTRHRLKSPNEQLPDSTPSDQWRIRDRSTPESKEIEIEGSGLEQFQAALKQALKKDRQAFEGQYKNEINDLLSLSREQIDSVTPDTMDLKQYDQLITVVKEASRNNVAQADLKARIEELGAVAVKIAKRVPSLAGLL